MRKMSRECVIVVGLLCSTVVVGLCLFSDQKDYNIEFSFSGVKFVKG